jgi:hypothetical protein
MLGPVEDCPWNFISVTWGLLFPACGALLIPLLLIGHKKKKKRTFSYKAPATAKSQRGTLDTPK